MIRPRRTPVWLRGQGGGRWVRPDGRRAGGRTGGWALGRAHASADQREDADMVTQPLLALFFVYSHIHMIYTA
eukprot:SAG22_NODE_551_length_9178_cov_3.565371_5_plen_73_part_00